MLPATPALLIPKGNQGFNAWLYPNPGIGNIKVHITGKPARVVDLLLTDNLGRVVTILPVYGFDGDHVETMQLRVPPGTYILVVKREDDVIRRKLIYR